MLSVFKGLAAILGKFRNKHIVVNNTLTRFYKDCDRYNVEVDDDPETAEEEEKFKKGPETRSLARTISQRLQLGCV